VPKDLPFPPGTYAYRNFPKLSGYERALFVVRVGTTQIAKLVLKQWPKAGYVLGRGDSEPGEVEDSFTKAPASGAFKANDVFCTPGYTVMYLVYANKGPVIPAPSPTASNTKPLVNKHHH
jgi:hypothetical protein